MYNFIIAQYLFRQQPLSHSKIFARVRVVFTAHIAERDSIIVKKSFFININFVKRYSLPPAYTLVIIYIILTHSYY